jgi:hypothetical protein
MVLRRVAIVCFAVVLSACGSSRRNRNVGTVKVVQEKFHIVPTKTQQACVDREAQTLRKNAPESAVGHVFDTCLSAAGVQSVLGATYAKSQPPPVQTCVGSTLAKTLTLESILATDRGGSIDQSQTMVVAGALDSALKKCGVVPTTLAATTLASTTQVTSASVTSAHVR